MKAFTAFVLTAVFAVSLWGQTNPLSMTTMAVVKDMGLGINLGNTFESNGDWINGSSVNNYETAWGSPTITKPMIDGYANAGFKTVRIPVAWSNLMTGNSSGGNYTVSTALLNRIAEVVDYVLDNGMYAIVNIHYDGGWWENFPTDSAECMKKYKRIWQQVSNKFKDYSGYLVFESLNEEGVWDDVWYIWRNGDDMTAKARAYGILNAINQEFTTLIRASGGNNADRHLLIAGYATNIDRTIDAMFKMPTDPQSRQAVSVHYYDPFGFTHAPLDNSWSDWAPLRTTWGTNNDYNELNDYMNKMKTNFVDKGIPVIVGEYGVAEHGRPENEIRKYTLAVAETIYERDMCPVLWDVQLADDETQYYYNRRANPPAFVDQQLVTGFKSITGFTTNIAFSKIPLTHFSVRASGKTLLVEASSPVTVEIYNLNGRKATTFNVSNTRQTVNLSLPSGVYFAKARGASMQHIRFVLK